MLLPPLPGEVDLERQRNLRLLPAVAKALELPNPLVRPGLLSLRRHPAARAEPADHRDREYHREG